MEYLTLNNGVQLPMVGFGTWDVRGEKGRRCILDALELGYRLIDTAQMYGNEAIVGEAVRESGLPRQDIFITTKLYRPSAGYQKAKAGIEKSLHELQTDYIDLVLIHEPYENAPEMYEALKEAYRAGKIRAIGVSNFDAQRYRAFIRTCGVIPAVDQVESHVYYPQLALKKLLEAHGTRMQSWASFTEGRKNIFAEPMLNRIGAAYGKAPPRWRCAIWYKTASRLSRNPHIRNGWPKTCRFLTLLCPRRTGTRSAGWIKTNRCSAGIEGGK